ncbi:hypothetical protein [Rhizobium leguminosarum]|uniref:hypothetical protein n=1 Tax=Rhizobium TaxID=379 RepID=UPI001040D381|nr:hypothetical protein [Rhizobium leguminosarum]TCA72260.1 hypothetical protein E0H69_18590 [Rhizobium leguminosarum bv. viciae]
MSDYPWNEKARSAQCQVRRANATYSLYAGHLPDMRGAAWFIRKGRRVIASGIAGDMGKALAQVEHAFENWTSKDWRVYG